MALRLTDICLLTFWGEVPHSLTVFSLVSPTKGYDRLSTMEHSTRIIQQTWSSGALIPRVLLPWR